MTARTLRLVLAACTALLLLAAGCAESNVVDNTNDGAVTGDAGGDSASVCIPACDWRECGVDPVCGESCGSCGDGEVCYKGSCIEESCTPDCSEVECGPDPVCGAYCSSCPEGEYCEDGVCVEGVCTPDCSGLECGPDPVCFESCGMCADGFRCEEGQCVEGPCEPQCEGLECGPDPRCGESCGECGLGAECSDDGICVPLCVPDCTGRQCGPDPICGESCGVCDDGCLCTLAGACDCNCEPQCEGLECGPDPVCGVSCGECEEGYDCVEGVCEGGCEPQCGDRVCGPDPVCGESCGTCPDGCFCGSNGQCECGYEGACANEDDLAVINTLDPAEVAAECVIASGCGQDTDCIAACIETTFGVSAECSGCYGDLSVCGLQNCLGDCVGSGDMDGCLACLEVYCMDDFEDCSGVQLVECEPQCGDLECGPDPVCSESCGTCGDGEFCEDGVCVVGPCEPECGDLECGPDPVCGESCGTCDADEYCEDGICVVGPCEPNCRGLECGPDPVCGQSCGTCPDTDACVDGACVCQPQCDDRECGRDPICGEVCGRCDADEQCVRGYCEPIAGGDACNNEEDLAILNTLDAMDVATTCVLGSNCGNDQGCIADCISDQYGISPDCAACYGALAVCGLQSCVMECLNGDEATCISCIEGACQDDFEDCAGVTWNPNPCEPDCSGLECGPDPVCGQSCGVCGFGETCDDGVCVEDPCEPDCRGLECGPDPVCGESCGSCPFGEICVDGLCESGVDPGACNNDADLALLNDLDALEVASSCVIDEGCGNDAGCVAECIEREYGVSAECSACYGDLAVCGLSACALQCIGGASDACLECLELSCQDDFEACAGITWTPNPCEPDCSDQECGPDPVCGESCGTCGDGETCVDGFCEPLSSDEACNNDADLAILNSLDPMTLATTCVINEGCGEDADCIARCIARETGMSDGCAACWGDFAVCGVQNCLTPCISDAGGEACLSCLDTNCNDDFEACSGVRWSGGGGEEAMSCDDPGAMACEGYASGDTSDGGSAFTNYSCVQFPETGAEHVYSFAGGQTVTITMSGLAVDLDLFLLAGSCDAASCLAQSSNGNTNDEVITYTTVAGTTYYIVIDGYEGAIGPYTLSLSCDGACVPDCSDTECGPDPVCGEDCGSCPSDAVCQEGICVPVSSGACDNAGDLQILATVDYGTIAQTCVMECFADTACMTECAARESGLSEGCSACVGDALSCAVSSCAMACLAGFEDPACLQCVQDSCADDFLTCSGIPIAL